MIGRLLVLLCAFALSVPAPVDQNRLRMRPRGSAEPPDPPNPPGGTEVTEIAAGTYNMSDVLALNPGSGTTSAVKVFRPAAGAAVIIRGGGTINVDYVTLDGSTGANSQLLIDGNLHPSAPTTTTAITVTGNNVTLKYLEMKGPHDFHYNYDLTNVPNTDESVGRSNNGALFVTTGSPVTLDHVWAHGSYGFLAGSSTGTLTITASLISNMFNYGKFGGASETISDSVLWVFPNHGVTYSKATSGGSLTLTNTLYVLSQEGPVAGQNDTPPTTGVDYMTVTHCTFVQPEIGTWGSYLMDRATVVGANTTTDGVRLGITWQNNVWRNPTKNIFSLDSTQYSKTLMDYNLWYSARTPNMFFTLVGGAAGVSTNVSFATWKTIVGADSNTIDSHSLFADPVFANPVALTSPQPNPGNAGNGWGHYQPTGATITDKINDLRSRYVLHASSSGFNAASDGRSMGIY